MAYTLSFNSSKVPVPTFASTGLPQSFTDNPGGGAATVTQAPDGIALTESAFGSDNMNTVLMNYPSTPFVIKGFFYLQQNWQTDKTAPSFGDSYGGFVIRNVGGNLQTYGPLNSNGTANGNADAFVINWTNATTVGVQPSPAPTQGTWASQAAIAYSDDGTTITYYYSLNPDAVNNTGYKWHTVYSIAKASNFITTPNKLGIFLSAHGSAAELVMTRFNLITGSSTL